MNKGKIKLVVVDERILGYIIPEMPDTLGIFHSSILRGASFEYLPEPKSLRPGNIVRLASKKDFDEYRVSMEGFATDKYEYAV